MSDWQPSLYLEFGKERTQPSIDLVARLDKEDPGRILDVGCGPGNSTRVLQARWGHAEIIGLDRSQAMIEEAKSRYPDIQWYCADASVDLSGLGTFDIVFSNAAIQWMPNQKALLSKLFGMLRPSGVLAVQVPCAKFMPVHTELVELASAEKWKARFEKLIAPYSVHTPDYYYDILCNLTDEVDLWETDYYHIMDSHSDIVRWSSASAMRPYLDCLPDESAAAEFTEEYELALREAYPLQPGGKILFPCTRIFFIVAG